MEEDNPFVTYIPEEDAVDEDPDLDPGDAEDDEQEEYFDDSEESEEVLEQPADLDPAVRQDMTRLEETFRNMGLKFRMIDRIGEGTFSTVYRAEDMHYDYFQNNWDIQQSDGTTWSTPPTKSSVSGRSRGPRRRTHRFVAIKKIYVTSSPFRIQNELELLHSLRNCDAICPLITAFRHQDQVVAILPHFEHMDFRMFYRVCSPDDIKIYFRCLFSGLAAVHKQGIIHRDIKPTNFLYNIETKRGVLVDFGLAEREGTDCSHCVCQDAPQIRNQKVKSSRAYTSGPPTGYPKTDQRGSRRANRAGTRGFRAPEVLLKCTAQTSKIDIWSAGVILLTILAQRFPFFNSADDIEALIEIATIFGSRRMKNCAYMHGAIFDCTLPTVGEKGYALETIIKWSLDSYKDEADDLGPEIKECVRFLERCLELDPKKRISARAALANDFLNESTGPESEVDELQRVE